MLYDIANKKFFKLEKWLIFICLVMFVFCLGEFSKVFISTLEKTLRESINSSFATSSAAYPWTNAPTTYCSVNIDLSNLDEIQSAIEKLKRHKAPEPVA